ncbi:hypothetical protein [Tomitella gaofuii]|uniref:hypothetical protein n=1 Tax=Tomitella gaofuii TaxID=2760083 RepID=UPI0015FAAC3A|nr:hypothetical protein [Tomitella gaofuii]
MKPVTRHADLILVSGEGLRTLDRMIVQTRLTARRNGVPLPAAVAELAVQVTAALDAARTLRGHAEDADGNTWITTSEYARRTGCSERSARRHAQRCGRRAGSRWQIPIKE